MPLRTFFAIGGIDFAKKSLFLPGTLSEVDEISKLAGQSNIGLSKLTGSQPTKDEVLKHLGHMTYAHLATHGFFDQPSESKSDPPSTPVPLRMHCSLHKEALSQGRAKMGRLIPQVL